MGLSRSSTSSMESAKAGLEAAVVTAAVRPKIAERRPSSMERAGARVGSTTGCSARVGANDVDDADSRDRKAMLRRR